jgi:hypothetical protein
VLFLAIVFPIALPPTVREATNALIKNCILKFNPYAVVILRAIKALIAPLNTPAISPTTSAQKLDTLSELRISLIAVLEPLSFLLALA